MVLCINRKHIFGNITTSIHFCRSKMAYSVFQGLYSVFQGLYYRRKLFPRSLWSKVSVIQTLNFKVYCARFFNYRKPTPVNNNDRRPYTAGGWRKKTASLSLHFHEDNQQSGNRGCGRLWNCWKLPSSASRCKLKAVSLTKLTLVVKFKR